MEQVTDKTASQQRLTEMSRKEGVSDLPGMAKMMFAKALVLEQDGDTAGAYVYLDKAIAAEARR